ncbi:MAG: biopolymer transporter ExbD [Chthoniobacterales bacterium]|nr:biopolymer transporter ExbD [Chthoniobacterales bacterium]
MQLRKKDIQTVEMQMGPMIDMVFLLLVFFMVTAKPVKQESDLNIGLPGTVAQEEALDIPDEQRITIRADGQILLNDQPMDSPKGDALPALLATLKRFKETADANKSEPLITIDADDAAVHQRIVTVLNTCAQAEITGITFADNLEEED